MAYNKDCPDFKPGDIVSYGSGTDLRGKYTVTNLFFSEESNSWLVSFKEWPKSLFDANCYIRIFRPQNLAKSRWLLI